MNGSAPVGEAFTHDLDHWIDDHIEEMLAFACRLVQTPSENRPPHGDELAAQHLLAERLEQAGAEVDLYFLHEVPELTDHPAYLPGRDYTRRPNVVGRFPGSGRGRSLLFSCHMDTAPREPLPWKETTPFSGELRDGRLWGRGSLDMKGGLAASLWAVLAARAVAGPLAGDVLIESVVDEEWAGSNGTLAGRLRGYHADAAILPEPTDLVICPEHLGVRLYRLTVPGSSGMVFSNPHLQNPIYTAIRFVEALQEYEAIVHARPAPPLYADVAKPPIMVTAIEAWEYGIPRTCTLEFAVSFYKDTQGYDVDREVASLVENAFADIAFKDMSPVLEPRFRLLPGSAAPADHEIVQVLQAAAAAVPGAPCAVRGAPLQCDAYVFNLYSSTPAVILGPSGGNAHTADEYVTVESLIQLVRTYARAIVSWCGTTSKTPPAGS